MNRIDHCVKEKENNLLSIYFTAGYPALNDTRRLIKALDKHGADMIEIGIPFSDPVADGPVIQESSKIALENGMSLNLLFEQLGDLRELTNMPVILMGYLNPVFRMGIEKFLDRCVKTGIDGVILPDFPPDEFEESYREMFKSRGIYNILLITPQTREDRIKKLDSLSSGFLYLVSSYATTGVNDQFSEKQLEYFRKIKAMNLKNPGLIGFGVSNNQNFITACKYSSGAIIGSAFIKAISGDGIMNEKVKEFIKRIRG